MLDFSGLSLPFSVTDLIGSGNGLVGFIGSILLCGLAFILVPELIHLIREAIHSERERKFFNSRGMPMTRKQSWETTWTMYKHNKSKRYED